MYAHSKYSGICSDCITPAERDAMLAMIGGAVIRSARGVR